MRIDKHRIEAHARERLGPDAGGHPGQRLSTFKRYLKLETDRLRMRHRFGLGGLEIASARSYQVDQVVAHACRVATADADADTRLAIQACAVVALGGYGRAELAPFSDVDLLFLHPGRGSDSSQALVEQVLQLLWDVGLSVGHSFRTIAQSVDEARRDLQSRTALGEARLVTGDARIFQALERSLDQVIRPTRRGSEAFEDAIRADVAERHARYGAVCVQEPNVKEGVGGLRDLHAVFWVAHARTGSRGLDGLAASGVLTPADVRVARRSYDFLLRVRAEAHFATKRHTDVLTLDLQPEVARALGYEERGGLLASELFMRDYYRRATELHDVYRTVMRRPAADPPRRLFGVLSRRRPDRQFTVHEGRLRARSADFASSGLDLLGAFAAAQSEDVPLDDELAHAIRSRLPMVDRALRTSPDAAAQFLDMLRWRGRVGRTLRAMHDTGFLGRYLPEFGRVSLLVQHDYFHRYTVDEHTLRAIEALDEIATGSDKAARPFGRVLDEIDDAAPLYLGMLLHDVGKGRGGAHVEHGLRIAPRACARLGLPDRFVGDVLFLIGEHLTMSQVSQQRDLTEPAIVDWFASRVGGIHRLNLLHLLTFADHRAVAPGIWNEWKSALLWELYERTRRRLAGHPEPSDPVETARARAIEILCVDHPATELERHFSLLPERYLAATDAGHMAQHFRLVERRGDAAAAFEWHDLPKHLCTELTLATTDRPGLLAAVAGTLTANSVNILSVDLFNRRDGAVIDTFRLSEQSSHRPVKPERRARVEREILDALEGRHEVATKVEAWRRKNPQRPKPALGRAARGPAVRFDQETSATATVVEVRAQDRPGLAWTIADTLARQGLDITFAKIATAKALALDVFYVTGVGGAKLAPGDLPGIEQALIASLGGRPTITDEEAE